MNKPKQFIPEGLRMNNENLEDDDNDLLGGRNKYPIGENFGDDFGRRPYTPVGRIFGYV